MFEQVLRAIQAHETVILHRHKTPDGDALGSQIGLKHLILENCPGKRVYAVGDGAGCYAFMADSVMDEIPDAAYENALAVLLDVSSPQLVSDGRFALARATARVDHHKFLDKIADVEVVDTSFESCCGLIAAMAKECGWRVPLIAAQSLMTGIITDSGRFRYDSVTARTFSLAAFLMEQPVKLNEIYKGLYTMELEQAKLRARYTQKITLTPHHVAYIYTTRQEMAEINADFFSISRGMVSLMNDLKGVEIWANFTESEEGVVVEIRSSRLDVCAVAMRYGGGGHMKACGATVRDRDEAMQLLNDLDRMAEENQ